MKYHCEPLNCVLSSTHPGKIGLRRSPPAGKWRKPWQQTRSARLHIVKSLNTGPSIGLVERAFYLAMAILLCVCVFIGFSPTYYQAGIVRAPLPSPILHIHGAVFTLWMLLFVVQAAFISARRVHWHRSLGTIAFCLPPLMIVLGVIAAIDALHRGVRIGPLDPAVSMAIPLLGITAFTIVIAASWRARRRPDAHKRLILIATMGLVAAAFGRFPWARIGFPPAAGAVTGLGCLLLMLLRL